MVKRAVVQKVDPDTYQCVNCSRKTPSYYPSDWQDRRLRVFQRDRFRCVYCGRYGGELHCDHVIPPSLGGTHAEGNLRTVCSDHHLLQHPEKAVKYQYFYKKILYHYNLNSLHITAPYSWSPPLTVDRKSDT